MSTPRRLGPYALLRCIGSGGMGEVWAAVHVELRMPCAIKLMKPDLRRDPDHACYEGLFLNEANICAQLRHGSIVRVHNAGFVEGQLFIAMDLVDGVNLWELVRTLESQGERLPLPLVAHVVAEVLEALAYAHNRTIGGGEGGIVHGDVSPKNIMISSHGEVLLTDFGVASLASCSRSSSKLLIGTPAYMAPERARGRVCRESDLYSVGAVLHELVTGRTPVPKGVSISELAARAEQPVPPVAIDALPEPLEALRRGLLESSVERRIGSTRHALALLERWPDHRHRAGELRALYQELFGEPHSGLTLSEGVIPELRVTWGSQPRSTTPGGVLDDTQPIEAPYALTAVLDCS